jgi:hypothetical protein
METDAMAWIVWLDVMFCRVIVTIGNDFVGGVVMLQHRVANSAMMLQQAVQKWVSWRNAVDDLGTMTVAWHWRSTQNFARAISQALT